MTDDVNAFLHSQGAKAFAFDNFGDGVTGEIVAMDLRQQTDMQSGDPLVWSNGAPRMVLVITLQTTLSDSDDDDGQRTVWLRGGNFTVARGKGTSGLNALKDAMRRAGVGDLEIGAKMSMQYTGDSVPSNKGFNPAKLYTCEYNAAVRSVSLDDLS